MSLKAWAQEGRIEPNGFVSNDRRKWTPAPQMAELEMKWVVEPEQGKFFGPFNRDVVVRLSATGAIHKGAKIYRLHELPADQDPKPQVVEKLVEKRVEVPVEKVVEKQVEVPVEKRVEVPVEKLVEKRVEVPVEKLVEKRVEVPVEKVVEKRVEVPVEKIVEKVVVKEVPVEKIVEKRVEVPVEKIVEKRVEVPVEKIVEKVVVKEVPVEKIVEKRVEVPVEKIVEKVVEKRVEVPVERIVEKIVEKEVRVEVPVEKIVEKVIYRDISSVPRSVVLEPEVVDVSESRPPAKHQAFGGIFKGADRASMAALEAAARRELSAAKRNALGGIFSRRKP